MREEKGEWWWKAVSYTHQFTRIYDLEVDYEQLSELENKEFGDLYEMVGRFSADEEELKIPNMFFSRRAFWIKQNM